MNSSDLRKFDAVLATLEESLSHRMSGQIVASTQDSLREVMSDEFDFAAILDALDVATTTTEHTSRTLTAVREARRKVREGTYGICVGSDRTAAGKTHTIPKTRLQVLPYAERCIDCQKDQEELDAGRKWRREHPVASDEDERA